MTANSEKLKTKCPRCKHTWDKYEIDWQECHNCGYPVSEQKVKETRRTEQMIERLSLKEYSQILEEIHQ